MKQRGAFPPPVGWIPAIIGLLALLALSAFAIAPQYVNGKTSTQVIGQTGTAGNDVAGTQGGPSSQGGGQTTTTTGPAQKGSAGITCAGGHNGGATDAGVTATELHVASTIVDTGIGSGFLGEAASGMQAAVNEVNSSGGLCGRHVSLSTINTGWVQAQGNNDISSYINSGSVFALVGEPDSEGLAGALSTGTIDRAGIPVVGTDGMLKDQYSDPWVWPVAASTVTNMHIIADYAVKKLGAKSFGIVYDTKYRFGSEGAKAFDNEVFRLTGQHIPGYDKDGCPDGSRFCGISADQTSDSDSIVAFNKGCTPACDAVVMLLEPAPMSTWMSGESSYKQAGKATWYKQLFGGEPLFDDKFAQQCAAECGGMTVWTGYHAAIQPFDAEAPVYTYSQSLKAACPSCDPHNEFTQGAYLGTRLFIEAVKRLQNHGLPLTRANLRDELNADSFDLGLASGPLHYGNGFPREANAGMAAFADNASGSFNGWNYLATQFLPDPARGQDF